MHGVYKYILQSTLQFLTDGPFFTLYYFLLNYTIPTTLHCLSYRDRALSLVISRHRAPRTVYGHRYQRIRMPFFTFKYPSLVTTSNAQWVLNWFWYISPIFFVDIQVVSLDKKHMPENVREPKKNSWQKKFPRYKNIGTCNKVCIYYWITINVKFCKICHLRLVNQHNKCCVT